MKSAGVRYEFKHELLTYKKSNKWGQRKYSRTFHVVLCLLYTYWDIQHFCSLFISNLSKMLKFAAATHREMTLNQASAY